MAMPCTGSAAAAAAVRSGQASSRAKAFLQCGISRLQTPGWLAGLIGPAAAQQPAPAPAPKKAAPAAPAQKGAPAAAGQAAPQSAWVKLCEKATAVTKDKDGKDAKKDVNICLTHHERLDGNSGM